MGQGHRAGGEWAGPYAYVRLPFKRKPFEVSLAVTKEITHPNHRQRQFMQHLRGVGWIMARTLPPNERTVKSLLQKGWIE